MSVSYGNVGDNANITRFVCYIVMCIEVNNFNRCIYGQSRAIMMRHGGRCWKFGMYGQADRC